MRLRHRIGSMAVGLAIVATTLALNVEPAVAAPAPTTESMSIQTLEPTDYRLYTIDMAAPGGGLNDPPVSALTKLDNALQQRQRSLGQVMSGANRSARNLCHPGYYQNLLDRSGSNVDGICWNSGDDGVDYWVPQGLTGTHDGYSSGTFEGRQILAATWYFDETAKGAPAGERGVRLTFVDWATRTYQHVLLVMAVDSTSGNYRTLDIHAGGAMWYGNLIYVPITDAGAYVFDINKIYEVSTDNGSAVGRQSDGTFQAYGYKYVMPAVAGISIGAVYPQPELKNSFISLDRSTSPHSFLIGEYTSDSAKPARIVRFPLNSSTNLPLSNYYDITASTEAFDTHILKMQGAVSYGGRYWANSSHNAKLGYLRTWQSGQNTARRYPWAIYPEDMTYLPASGGRIWTLTEEIAGRSILSVPAADWS